MYPVVRARLSERVELDTWRWTLSVESLAPWSQLGPSHPVQEIMLQARVPLPFACQHHKPGRATLCRGA